MKRMSYWAAAAGVAVLCGACAHNAGMSAGTVAPGAAAYDLQVWSGNKKAEVPFPSQDVTMSLRWADADEGIATWKEGFASNTQARDTVRVSRGHGPLRAVRVALAGDPTQTGPALVIDSVGVTAEGGAGRFICSGSKDKSTIRPGTSSDLPCHRQ